MPISSAGPPLAGLAREILHRGPTGALEGRLEHQILGRIAGDEQFGEHDEVGAVGGRLRAGATGLFRIAGDVADDGVELSEGDRQFGGRGRAHGD